jgi:hypothetical protein
MRALRVSGPTLLALTPALAFGPRIECCSRSAPFVASGGEIVANGHPAARQMMR